MKPAAAKYLLDKTVLAAFVDLLSIFEKYFS